jgi:curved DNA-binding protein CbpA
MASSTVEEDLYALLGFDTDAVDVFALGDRELARAYRKQALRWHPDKNRPGDDVAASMLARVFVAYETLSDPASRAAHDEKKRALAARELERARMDQGRRRLRDDLVRREQAAEDAAQLARERDASRQHTMPEDLESRLRREIDRLRTELGLRRQPPADSENKAAAEESDMSVVMSEWAQVPGFAQWHAGSIEFLDLEAAVLERAQKSCSGGASDSDGTSSDAQGDVCTG